MKFFNCKAMQINYCRFASFGINPEEDQQAMVSLIASAQFSRNLPKPLGEGSWPPEFPTIPQHISEDS